jgi:hypothetical protein
MYPAATDGQRAIIVREHSLVDICDILGADRFELVNEQVTFVKRLRLGDSISWTAQLGDELIGQGMSERGNSDWVAETTWSFVA